MDELTELLAMFMEDVSPEAVDVCQFVLCVFIPCDKWDAEVFTVHMN